MPAVSEENSSVIHRLRAAMNTHDLEAFVACFHPDYRSEQPAHPDRAFQGVEQVRQNWSKIFAGIPDFRADILAHVSDGDTHWTEWRWHGTNADGSRLELRGVTIFGAPEDRLLWGRLYLEPVEHAGAGIDAAVDRMAGAAARSTRDTGDRGGAAS
ncbi:MAG: nuclear transport factor 2 family protein [Chloroflexota bacterium]|nr:nuclear transport factor 2 family protein [Chloroflexota bacterium]